MSSRTLVWVVAPLVSPKKSDTANIREACQHKHQRLGDHALDNTDADASCF